MLDSMRLQRSPNRIRSTRDGAVLRVMADVVVGRRSLGSVRVEGLDAQGGGPDAGQLEDVWPFHRSAAEALDALQVGEVAAAELAAREARATEVGPCEVAAEEADAIQLRVQEVALLEQAVLERDAFKS